MADTTLFFNDYLPKKLEAKPGLKTGGKVYHFEITGAGDWAVDLASSVITEGVPEKSDCKITVAKADWEKVLDNPASAMMMFMSGKIKATNVPLAAKLQEILK